MLEQLLTKLNSVPSDKVAHALGGVMLFALTAWIGLIVSFLVCAYIAIAKEIYDLCHRDQHTPDAWDAVATLVGWVIGWACALSFYVQITGGIHA